MHCPQIWTASWSAEYPYHHPGICNNPDIAAFCISNDYYDDLHLHLRSDRRPVRLKLRWKDALCRPESGHALCDDPRRYGIYDRNRRKRPCGNGAWLRQKGKSEPDLYHADFVYNNSGHPAQHHRHAAYPPGIPVLGRYPRHAAGLRIIRAGDDCFYRRFYAAERISELSCSGRKAKAWTCRHHNRRRYQCPAGRCFYCRLQMGAGRSGSCHRNRAVHRRHTALDLLFKAEFQPASADSCQTGAKTDPENLCQRLLRGHVQRFFLHR